MIKPIEPKRIFVKLLMPYLLGTGLSIGFGLNSMLWPVGILLLILSGLLVATHRYIKPLLGNNVNLWAILLFGWMAYAGILHLNWADPTIKPQHYTNTAGSPGLLLVQIEEVPIEQPNTYRLIAEVIGRKQGDSLVPLIGKVMLLLELDSSSQQLKYGDILAVNSQLQPISPALNPYEFDYRQYLAHKHIHYQLAPKPNR